MSGHKWERDLDRPNSGTRLEDALPYRKDRERAYREGFDEFIDRAISVRLGAKAWRVHPNVNLYLDITGHCTSSCPFCIARTTYPRGTASPVAYLDALRKAREITSVLSPSVQIVGGEPTVDPKLPDVLDAIQGMRRPVLGTNGARLDDLVDVVNRSDLEHVNISRHHWDDGINGGIFVGGVPTGHELSETIHALRPAVRLQCNMIGGVVDDFSGVLRFLDFAMDCGADAVAFAQLTPLPRCDIYQDRIIDYVASHQVDFESILASVSSDTRFVFEKYRGGVACYYEVWRYSGVPVLFKMSDNEWLRKADLIPDCIPDLVLHTNGRLCASWNREIKEIA